jgi:hypothetical protein
MVQLLRRLVILSVTACAVVVAAAQESARVTVPDIAKAGETVNLDITVDKAPNFDGGGLTVIITGPNNLNISSGCSLPRGERTCRYPFHLPPDAQEGTWSVTKLLFFTGSRQIDLSFKPLPFQVIANSGLVFPTSAEVTVNPSQVQLLRREATRLQTELQTLKATVTVTRERSSSATEATLRLRVQDEIKSVNDTESRFRNLSAQKAQTDVAQIFFDDLRTSYEQVLDALQHKNASGEPRAAAITVAWSSFSFANEKKNEPPYTLAAQTVFRVFEQNELAYKLVADTESLAFDLDVESSPAGAIVSYRRRGDQYQENPAPTNSVIKALPYAIWIVRFQKPGFVDKAIEHDPFREPNHIVRVELSKK